MELFDVQPGQLRYTPPKATRIKVIHHRAQSHRAMVECVLIFSVISVLSVR